MVDNFNTIWVDSTFVSKQEGVDDLLVVYTTTEADIIGEVSIPVAFYVPNVLLEYINHQVEYNANYTLVSGFKNVPLEYQVHGGVDYNYISIPTEYFNIYTTTSGYLNIPVIYSTGYLPISGLLDRAVVFTVGNKYSTSNNILTSYRLNSSISGSSDHIINYTSFSGDTTISGEPIPFHTIDYNCLVDYSISNSFTDGSVDRVVDISFSGWPSFPFMIDVYSVNTDTILGFNGFINTISGSVDRYLLETFCSSLIIKDLDLDFYCALTDYASFNSELETIKGRISLLNQEIYSTDIGGVGLELDIDLFSLKVSNFYPPEGEFTTASGYVSVDITDDVCPVSTSGTYFMVDDVKVDVTFTTIEDGYRMYYNPEDNFTSIEGPTVFTVHAENICGNILETDYYLVFGYFVEYENARGSIYGTDFGFDNKVLVRVSAENFASCPQLDAFAWDFKSNNLNNNDLTANIVGILDTSASFDLQAQIYPKSTAYFYGKDFRVVVRAKDFAGNEMEPFILSYRIENKPN